MAKKTKKSVPATDRRKKAKTGEGTPPAQRPRRRTVSLTKARLDALVADATVDCYDDEEQVTGLFTMMENDLALPFETTVLGMTVQVVSIALRGRTSIVAICEHGRERQAVELHDLPLPTPTPAGVEWIEAYRHWSRF